MLCRSSGLWSSESVLWTLELGHLITCFSRFLLAPGFSRRGEGEIHFLSALQRGFSTEALAMSRNACGLVEMLKRVEKPR